MKSEAPRLAVRKLSYEYPGFLGVPGSHVLEYLSMSISPREIMVIFGAADAGKTTLSRILAGLIPRFTGGEMTGDIAIGDVEIRAALPCELVEMIGLVFQNSDEQIFTTRCDTEVAFALESLGIPPGQMRRRIDHALTLFGLESFRLRNPATLSGGEKKRLLIACLVAIDAGCWVLDEVFEELDHSWKCLLLDHLRREGKTALFLDSRWSPLYGPHCSGFSLIQGGKISFSASDPTSSALEAELEREGMVLPPSRAFPSIPSGCGDAFLHAECLCFSFTESDPFSLNIESLEIRSGAVCALVGRNGSGKSTLGKLLCGLLVPRKGSILLRDGAGLRRATPRELNRAVGYLFQNPDYQVFLPTVFDELALGLRSAGSEESEVRARVEEAIQRFQLPRWDSPPALMSYGARKRLQAATYSLLSRKLLILDEIDSGLSYRDFLSLLAELASGGTGIIIVTHDIALARAVSERVMVMDRGRIEQDLARDRFQVLDTLAMETR